MVRQMKFPDDAGRKLLSVDTFVRQFLAIDGGLIEMEQFDRPRAEMIAPDRIGLNVFGTDGIPADVVFRHRFILQGFRRYAPRREFVADHRLLRQMRRQDAAFPADVRNGRRRMSGAGLPRRRR